MQQLFDHPRTAKRAAEIGQAILAARSLRLSEIAFHMRGSHAASYKRLQRFLHQVDPRVALERLFWEQAEFVMGDPTEIERPQARKTAYVGTLKDGKSQGFWVLLLGTPYRGRVIPCGFVTYSSKTIAASLDSRNLNHLRAFAGLKDLLGERPLVLDREFSYLELLLDLVAEGVNFVIRLHLGRQAPRFWDADGREVVLAVARGETITYHQVWYKGKVCVNLIGTWERGLHEPLWVMTNLDAESALRIYRCRMKIEQTFRDLKDKLGMQRLMNKRQSHMEKMLALLLLVYAIALLIGEGLRDRLYGQPPQTRSIDPAGATPIPSQKGRKWKCYSGLFVLLCQKWSLPVSEWREVLAQSLTAFTAIVQPTVPTYV
jgi:hypothetical protein